LNPKPMIILTTAYDQHALKAFDLEVKDYLLKPFAFERFYKGVLRLYQEQSQQSSDKVDSHRESKQESGFIFLKVGHRIQRVSINEILFVEGMKDYLRIHTQKEKIMSLLSFSKLEELLPGENFVRVHRSFMVAIDKIDHIEKNRIRIGNELIPISETYSDSFYRKLRGVV
jgi:DNA-binding LytR/AlgR family response regulator